MSETPLWHRLATPSAGAGGPCSTRARGILTATADDADDKNQLSSGLNPNHQNNLQSADDTDDIFVVSANNARVTANGDGDGKSTLPSPVPSPLNR